MSAAHVRPAGRRRFSDQTLRRIGWTLSTLSIALVPTTLILHAWAGALDQMVTNFALHDAVNALCYGALGLILIKSEPRNRLVWFFVAVGVCTGVTGLISGSVELIAQAQGVAYEEVDLSGWPSGSARLIGQFHALWPIANFGLPTLGLLLAPDGRLLSRRWRPVAVFSSLAIIGSWLLFAAKWPLLSNDAIESYDDSMASAAAALGFVVVALMIAASYVSLVLRYRRSDPASRRRLRWLLAGGTLFVAAYFVSFLGPALIDGVNDDRPFLLVFYPILAISFGLAIWRDQLFDVDVVISRTLVYASTLAMIAGIYVAVVFGIGALVGRTSDASPVLPIVATAVIAMVFHPARVRLERLANRIVFGRRATPYEVLSEFTRRVAATDDELLVDVARSLVDATIATSATVWTVHDDRLAPLSVWPERQGVMATAVLRAEEGGHLLVPGADQTYPIQHHGELVGALGLSVPAGESLTPADQSLISELAAGIGLALWNRQLTADLRASVDDLRASRRRLVAIQDDTRHSLERDLHDGAQQRLVAVKVRLSIAQQMASKAGTEGRAERLAVLCGQADEAIESLRDFARGVYPPLLEAEGLRAAIDAHVNGSRLPIEVTGTVGRRQQREIEATVYFCIVETLGLVEEEGRANTVEITLTERPECLAFDVRASHDGTWPLVLPDAVRDRVEAVDGTLASVASLGIASVAGSVPIPAAGRHPVVPGDTGGLIHA